MKSSQWSIIICKSLVFCGCENCSRQPRPFGTEKGSPVTLFTQTYNPWNWRWESQSPFPSLTRSIIPQGLSAHHFPITQAGDSSTSCTGKVSIGVMKLTATQISWHSASLPFLCLIPLLLNITLKASSPLCGCQLIFYAFSKPMWLSYVWCGFLLLTLYLDHSNLSLQLSV